MGNIFVPSENEVLHLLHGYLTTFSMRVCWKLDHSLFSRIFHFRPKKFCRRVYIILRDEAEHNRAISYLSF